MAKSFLAELHRQQAVAAREAERSKKAASGEHQAAMRKLERAQAAEKRATAQASRAEEANRTRLEKEAKAAHVAAMQAQADERNAAIVEVYEELDGLLDATIDVDDYIDLESLRRTVGHPPFDRPDLEIPVDPPDEIREPPKPTFVDPGPVSGLFGKKKKRAEAMHTAEERFDRAMVVWQHEVDAIPQRRQEQAAAHAELETERLESLAEERRKYEAACGAREAEVSASNDELENLIVNLAYGTAEAVQEYISIVISNSVYPSHFEVAYDFVFDASVAELRMKVKVPPPSAVPSIKSYKYTKATDEITSTDQSQKASKDRYAGAVQQVALRTLHEVFESDRRGLIRTVSLEVGTETSDPATGNQSYVPFVAAAAERESFIEFDLSAVVPAATLDYMGAAVSKNPLGLVAVDTGGVRRS